MHWGPTGRPATGDVRAFDWSTVDAGAAGETSFLDPNAETLRPLQMAPDFNLAARAERLGGVYDNKESAFDGDLTTSWRDIGYKCSWIRSGCNAIYASVGTHDIDLGGDFLIDRIVLRSGLNDQILTVRDFRIHLSPTLPKTLWCCGLRDPVIVDVRDNREQVREVQLDMRERSRFLQLAAGESDVGWEIEDIEVYGKGFVERATYTSDVITFDQPMAWGQIGWSATEGAGAHVRIQTRTGSDTDPVRHWRNTGRGQDKAEVSRSEYAKLKPGERAGTSHDHQNWSFWSEPYDLADSSGTQMLSPGPRRYFQLRVDFQPEEQGGEVRYLQVQAWPPAASALVGEIWPVDVAAGTVRSYTYAVRPTIGAQHTGFDRLEISSASFLGQVRQVRIADDVVAWEVEQSEPHRLVLRLPLLQAGNSGTLVEVDFDAQVLRYGDSFDGRVWYSNQSDRMAQRIDPGDATGQFEGNRLSVATSEQSDRLLRVVVDTRVLTPNADGANDVLNVAYDILEATGDVDVSVIIHDLAGRHVRRLHDGQQPVGRYVRRWDGTDNHGRQLPVGVYLLHVALTADSGSDHHTTVVHIAR